MLEKFLTQFQLSNNEATIVGKVVSGNSNAEIAKDLNITESTVKLMLANIYSKMGLTSRAQLIIKCIPHLTWTVNA